MYFTTMFWNVWYENQFDDRRIDALSEALEDFIKEFNPDVIGLNEVVEKAGTDKVPLDRILESLGYKYSHFAPTNKIKNGFVIGSSLYSKGKIFEPKSILLGKNSSSQHLRKHFEVSAVSGNLKVNNKKIHIVVAHPVNVKPSTLLDHYRHTKELRKLLQAKKLQLPTIIGGDMNEPRFFPYSLKRQLRTRFNHKSGSFRNPTWRFRGHRAATLRANLDRMFWSKHEELSLKSFHIIDTNISDHRPMIAKFAIK